jgi:hypothetical protein
VDRDEKKNPYLPTTECAKISFSYSKYQSVIIDMCLAEEKIILSLT